MTPRSLGLWALLAATGVRLLVAAAVPLYPDEAYYWEWSRHLAAGYFDHPPLIAVLIRAGTVVMGDTPLGVRLLPVLSGLIAGWAVMRMACILAGKPAGDAAALAFVALPVMSGVFVLATPDAPLLAFAACAMFAVVRALASATATPATTLPWWLVAGLWTGLAMASKYTAVIMPLALFLGILATPALRGVLRTPGPYAAVAVATLLFLPVLQWNAAHDWVSFRFQLAHGLGAAIDRRAWNRELELIGGQLLLASPVLGVLGVTAVVRAWRGDDRIQRVLAAVAVVTMLLFCWSALRRRVEANWPGLAWLPVAALLGTTAFAGVTPRWRRLGLGLGLMFTAVLYLQSVWRVVPIPSRRDPTSKAYGWGDLAMGVGAQLGTGRSPWVAANRYQDAAELAFHLPGHPPVLSLNLESRDNQYRFWPLFPDRARVGDDLLLVLGERPSDRPDPALAPLAGVFGSIEQGALIVLRRGPDSVGVRRLWLLRDWRGAWPAPPQ